MRRMSHVASWVTVLSGLLAPTAFAVETVSLKVAKVNVSSLNIYKGPGTGYSIAGVAHSGETYVVLNASGAWAEIQWAELAGWIYTGSAIVSSGSGLTGVEVTSLMLNVRTGPGSTYAIVGQTHDGSLFVQSAVSGSWRKISFGGAARWIYGGYTRTFALPTFHTSNVGSPVRPALAVVSVASLNVRRGPGGTFPVIGAVTQNQRYVVLNTSGVWKQIQYGHDLGWVNGDYTRANTSARLVRVTRLLLAVRSAASSTSTWVGHAHNGQYFAWMGKNAAGDWIKICYGGVIRWVQTAGTYEDKSYYIQVSKPTPNQVVTSPLTVDAKVRGWWMFEGYSNLTLLDANGVMLAFVHPTVLGDSWTDNFVPITATLTFTRPVTQTGTLLFQADNPSGLEENDNEYRLPVRFW